MERTVVSLSFDDGRKDNFQNAYRIMEKYGIKATIHITTGFVDGSWNEHSWKSCDKAMSIDEVVEMSKNGYEMSLHGDKHKSESADFITSRSKLEAWGIPVKNIGFSIPNSDLSDSEKVDFVDFLKKEGVAYMRGGRNPKCYSFVSKCCFALYKYLGLQFAYNLFNKHNLNVNYDRYNLDSVVVRSEDKAKNIIQFIEKNKKDSWIILMLHSILSKQDEKYGSDAWYWDDEQFELLCIYLSQVQKNGKIEVKTIIENLT